MRLEPQVSFIVMHTSNNRATREESAGVFRHTGHRLARRIAKLRYVDNWHRGGTALNWELRTSEPMAFVVEADVHSEAGGELKVRIGTTEWNARLPRSGDKNAFTAVRLGEVEIGAGEHVLELRSEKEGWSATRLRAVRLLNKQ